MSESLTRADLTAALETHTEVLKRDLADRFEHYEKRATNRMAEHERREDERHREMMQGFAQVIENVNDHTTAELTKLRADLGIRQEFDHLAMTVAQRFGLTVHDLTGR
jgi:hypothetical protein